MSSCNVETFGLGEALCCLARIDFSSSETTFDDFLREGKRRRRKERKIKILACALPFANHFLSNISW